MSSCTGNKNIPIACDLTAIPLVARQTHISDGLRVFELAQEVRQLADGHAFRFANQPGILVALATYVEYERLCCPFYTYEIAVEQGGGPIWLRLTTGESEDVNDFEKSLLSDVNQALRSKLINSGNDSRLEAAVAESAAILAEVWDKASTA